MNYTIEVITILNPSYRQTLGGFASEEAVEGLLPWLLENCLVFTVAREGPYVFAPSKTLVFKAPKTFTITREEEEA